MSADDEEVERAEKARLNREMSEGRVTPAKPRPTKPAPKLHHAPRCPRCASINVSLDTVEWDAVSREDDSNRPLLVEHECRDCSLSFWTGANELVEPPAPPKFCPKCVEPTEVNALAQVVCVNEKCHEHVVWEVR